MIKESRKISAFKRALAAAVSGAGMNFLKFPFEQRG